MNNPVLWGCQIVGDEICWECRRHVRVQKWMLYLAQRPEGKCLPVWEPKSKSVDDRKEFVTELTHNEVE